MNLQSTTYQNMPNLHIHKLQLFRWLKKIKEQQEKQKYYQYCQMNTNETEFYINNKF